MGATPNGRAYVCVTMAITWSDIRLIVDQQIFGPLLARNDFLLRNDASLWRTDAGRLHRHQLHVRHALQQLLLADRHRCGGRRNRSGGRRQWRRRLCGGGGAVRAGLVIGAWGHAVCGGESWDMGV